MNNAAEASPPGARVLLRVEETEKSVIFSVEDWGKGMDLSRIAVLGTQHVSFDKPSSGLERGFGTMHAAQTIRSVGGIIRWRQKFRRGIIVEFTLPKEVS